MRFMRPVRFTLALAVCFSGTAFGLDVSKLKPSGYVNDFAHAIDPRSAQALEVYCGNLEQATGVQMAIVTVESLDGDPIEDVTNNLYHQWGVGKKGKDEGIMLLLAIKDHKQRAEIGYGLEPVITDADAGAILRGIRPILRQGNYGGALLAAATQFGIQISREKGVPIGVVPPTGRTVPQDGGGGSGGIFGIIIAIIVVIFILRLFSGFGGFGGGGGSGFLTGMILSSLLNRRRGWGGGGFGGFDGGGGGGGWGGGGGGFGGFGGGDSGGGGASGDW